MDIRRRDLVSGLGGLAAASSAASASVETLARPGDFAIPGGHTYINSAYIHPMPVASAENLKRYIAARSQPDGPTTWDRIDIKAEFAALINAKPSEIAYIPNTSTGENLVVKGLGLPASGGNVVTDALHFEGALLHLNELKKQGLDLRIVQPRQHRIHLRDLERVIDRNTKLVEISHVAMFTGFQHDLKAVCDLAHAHGALVYADIAQSAGCTPIDVKAMGVDFAACSSFKWLMGDFGLGFLYVREDLLDRVVSARSLDTSRRERWTRTFCPTTRRASLLSPTSSTATRRDASSADPTPIRPSPCFPNRCRTCANSVPRVSKRTGSQCCGGFKARCQSLASSR
jgi:kynureninase